MLFRRVTLPLDCFSPIALTQVCRSLGGRVALFEREGAALLAFDTSRDVANDLVLKVAESSSIPSALKKFRERVASRAGSISNLDDLKITPGLLGYITYEYAGALEPKAFALPTGTRLARLIEFQKFFHFDYSTRRLDLIVFGQAPFDGGSDRALKEMKRLVRSSLSQATALPDQELELSQFVESALTQNLVVDCSPGDWNSKIGRVKKHIQRGDIFQAVLSRGFELRSSRPRNAPKVGNFMDPLSIYRCLRSSSPVPYQFFLDLEDETILGASPELLLKARQGEIETCPIAGTRRRGKTRAEDLRLERQLLNSPKEKAEHRMLVDLGRNDLGRVAQPGTVTVPETMQVRRFSNVMHLVSTVKARLRKGVSAWSALEACFPAGTLSGAPKVRAMQIISELESELRGVYGGAIVLSGYDGSLDSCIAIRTMRFSREGVVTFRAGAGIVADSRASREYQEIIDKTGALRTAIGAAVKLNKNDSRFKTTSKTGRARQNSVFEMGSGVKKPRSLRGLIR